MQGTGPVILVRKALRLCKVLVKIRFIGASTGIKKRVDGVTSLQMLGTLNGAASDGPPVRDSTWCRSHLWRGYPVFFSFKLLQDFLKRKHFYSSFLLSEKNYVHENFVLHCWIKSRPQRWHNHHYQVGAACRFLGCNKLAELAEVIPQPRDTQSTAQTCACSASLLCGLLTLQCAMIFQSGSLQRIGITATFCLGKSLSVCVV